MSAKLLMALLCGFCRFTSKTQETPAYGQGSPKDQEFSPGTDLLDIYNFIPHITECAYWRGLLFSQLFHFPIVCLLAPWWVAAASESLWGYTDISASTLSDRV